MLCNVSFISHLQWMVLCTSHVLPNCSEGANWNIGCRHDFLELVIVQPGLVILVIALSSLRHLVINTSNLSIRLAGQSFWSGAKCNWQVIVHVLYTVYICYFFSTSEKINRLLRYIFLNPPPPEIKWSAPYCSVGIDYMCYALVFPIGEHFMIPTPYWYSSAN